MTQIGHDQHPCLTINTKHENNSSSFNYNYNQAPGSAEFNQTLNFKFFNQQTTANTNNKTTFLRVYFDKSTTVVEKKNVSLRTELTTKLKKRNLDIDKCVAYLKDKNLIIDWDIEASRINDNEIVISPKDEVKHNLVKKLIIKDKFFSNRTCASCKRVCNQNFWIYSCKKCEQTLCQNNECKKLIEKTICIEKVKKPKPLLKTSATSVFTKPKSTLNMNRPSNLKRKWLMFQNNSEQILPITQITPSIRARSLSDPESLIDTLKSDQSINSNESSKESSPTSSKNKKPNRWSSAVSWEIPQTRIQINKKFKIGAGSFGVVHKGIDFYHGVVAVKFLNVDKPTSQQIRAFKNEVTILKSTRHDNILMFIGCFLGEQLAIVTEWCPGSSLYRHLHVDEVYWSIGQLVDISKQISTGMQYLHAKDILHRDLKSNNIFLIPKEEAKNLYAKTNNGLVKIEQEKVSYKWTVKIGDFGLATVKSLKDENAKKGQPTGSILWMAPEVIKQKVDDPYTQKSDVYAYAVVLYELFTGSLPFQNKEQNMILFLVGSGRLKVNPNDCREDTPNEIREFIVVCSQYDRDKRLNFMEINKILNGIEIIERREEKIIRRSQSLPNLYVNTEELLETSSHSDEVYLDLGYGDIDDEEIYTDILNEPESPLF